ncbi:hypothetical protein FHX08_005463 [Rhizobium sp. BK529]|nr:MULTISPECIES: hypothetical protein [unclassified Rhizobium]MBB3595053.1 hypothetical protein [Rhizobium sp. BK529]TCR98688.1 hypothetical protein EV281_10878 [Rhizobium sp. BK418]
MSAKIGRLAIASSDGGVTIPAVSVGTRSSDNLARVKLKGIPIPET